MNTLKKSYFNIFLSEIVSIFFVFGAGSIPLIEFINSNFKELDNIFNNNFFYLLVLYFSTIFLIFFFIKLLIKNKSKVFHVLLASISIWVFFQYNLLKIFLNKLFTGNYIWHFSSEIALLLIIISIILLTFLLKKNNSFRFYVSFFLILNFSYKRTILASKLIS